MITPLPNGHAFAGSAREYDAAEVAHCQRCGTVVKNRHGAITAGACRDPFLGEGTWHSAPFVPTEAQMQSPLLMALYHRTGTTEREAIELLYQQNVETWRIAERLAVFQSIGSILAGGVTFTNPTADKLGAEGHARTLAAILAEERQKGRADERARVTRIRNKAFAGKAVDLDMRRLIEDFDGMLVRGEDDAT